MDARVVLVESLGQFGQEVEGTRVRLCLNEQTVPGSGKVGPPMRRAGLDLQGVNEAGEIVWLHYEQRVLWGAEGPFFERDGSVYAGMRRMFELVMVHLDERGYEVRGGRYGLPGEIVPMGGMFECVRWVRDGEQALRVELVEGGGPSTGSG